MLYLVIYGHMWTARRQEILISKVPNQSCSPDNAVCINALNVFAFPKEHLSISFCLADATTKWEKFTCLPKELCNEYNGRKKCSPEQWYLCTSGLQQHMRRRWHSWSYEWKLDGLIYLLRDWFCSGRQSNATSTKRWSSEWSTQDTL